MHASPSPRTVWIEIGILICCDPKTVGHRPRGRCGLKFFVRIRDDYLIKSPSPRTVWIEITLIRWASFCRGVTVPADGVD